MNINAEVIHDNQNEGVGPIALRIHDVGLNLKEMLRDYPAGLHYGNETNPGFTISVNPGGTPSMSWNNGGLTLFVDSEASSEWPEEEAEGTNIVTIEGYTLADRLILENKTIQVITQVNGE